jgi:hypothetical protein
MNLNYGVQNASKLAWSGTAARPIDIRSYVGFSFSFETTAVLAADTVFNIKSAPASGADPCVPGTFVPVPEVLTCTANFGAQPGPQASIVLPAGTPAGALCTAALPCRPDAFIELAAGSGDTASVVVTVGLHGPK